MEILNIIAAIATIGSFILSLIVLNKVTNIENKINTKQTVKGDKNITSGRDSNVTR